MQKGARQAPRSRFIRHTALDASRGLPDTGPKTSHFIREFIVQAPVSHADYRQSFPEGWHWKQANGALRKMIRRGLSMMLSGLARSRFAPCGTRPESVCATRSAEGRRYGLLPTSQ